MSRVSRIFFFCFNFQVKFFFLFKPVDEVLDVDGCSSILNSLSFGLQSDSCVSF